jgi:hypothetical protein
VKREQESIDLRAQKLMRGRMEQPTMPIVVKAVLIMVYAIRQIATIPYMTFPSERQPKEKRLEIP